ncbi:replicative helicase loader/inhibitor [Bacillus sp. FJAT-27251]|uniref:replicative helicase loader/inhibitor n=1 Tax=Bacillus sp. FJAT-27251 TaxID=1684142 RepID=UPI0006A7B07B|nr:replicative helicase loader/inhibitor [Bacillus sp. FJAT-27251]
MAMGSDEVSSILVKIQSAYPHFKVCDDTLLLWMKMGREMDFSLVMRKLLLHIARSPYPPSIAEIAAYRETENSFLEKNIQWEREGRERIEHDKKSGKRKPEPAWISLQGRK